MTRPCCPCSGRRRCHHQAPGTTTGTTNSIPADSVDWSPPPLSRRPPPGGRALDWGHHAPRRGGNQRKKECQIKTQTGDGQKFATVARAHGQAKQLGHKSANLNDAPPRPPNVNVATVRSSAGLRTFVRKRPARTTVHIATTLRLGGLWGAAVATQS